MTKITPGLTLHNGLQKKIRLQKLKKRILSQPKRMIKIKQKPLKRVMRIPFWTRTLTNRGMV